MEVIDAEYQWWVAGLPTDKNSRGSFRDRRKLTFYFIAEKRIDFRELVRELFRCVMTAMSTCLLTKVVGYIKLEYGWRRYRKQQRRSSNDCEKGQENMHDYASVRIIDANKIIYSCISRVDIMYVRYQSRETLCGCIVRFTSSSCGHW